MHSASEKYVYMVFHMKKMVQLQKNTIFALKKLYVCLVQSRNAITTIRLWFEGDEYRTSIHVCIALYIFPSDRQRTSMLHKGQLG